MELKHLTCPALSVKAVDDDQGIVEAIVNVYNLTDLGGDRVLLGCFEESIKRRKPYCVLSHDWQRPLGKTLEAKELAPGHPLLPEELRDYGGLYTKTQYNLDTQDGRETYSNLKKGVIDQFSIGFDPKQHQKAKDGARELVKGDLYEYGPTLWGMNQATAVVAVKSLEEAETKGVYLGEYAAESMTLAALRDACDALFYRAIYGILYDYDGDRTSTEKVEMIDGAIAEFHTLAVSALRAMLTAEGDDASESEAEYKQVFAVPARMSGRFDRQLLALLTEAESARARAEGLVELRKSQGRSPFSPERHGQLKALHEALGSLVETTAPTPEILDTTLLQRQAAVELERLKLSLACGGV